MTQKIRFYEFAKPEDVNLNVNILPDEELPKINTTSNGYSFEEKPSKVFDVTFLLLINKDIFSYLVPNIVHEDENDYAFYVSYISSSSRKRETLELVKSSSVTLNNDIAFEGSININPSEWFGSISFNAVIVRKKTRAPSRGYLTRQYSIVGSSDDTNIYIDPLEKFDGSDIEMDDGKISRDNALYELIQSSTPRLIINEEAPEFTLKMLRYRENDTTRRALVRDALFAPIIVDVWEQLARAAMYKMIPESESEEVADPKSLPFPYKNIAQLIAKKLYGGNQEEANNSLISQLDEVTTRTELINEILPVVVQEVGELNKYYERVAKTYWRDQ
tara:strand:- start:1176 stop:2171 length:996 start_codon:yes stop_codon:yes gene_type:complete